MVKDCKKCYGKNVLIVQQYVPLKIVLDLSGHIMYFYSKVLTKIDIQCLYDSLH